jgi:Carboxypeptidase regulatory-like domain/TonB-dependent Receptor Plug Domain
MRKAVALALVAIALFVPAVARAQSDSGEIHIVVTDAATKAPIDLARVLLDGAVMASELTSKNGQVVFTDVPDGIYRARIVKRGYSSLTSKSFEVLDGRVVTVSVALVEETNGLKVIGTVSVKASATISSTSINQDSAQRRLSEDLAGALNKLSGVSVDTSSDDSDATQTISLEGHDPSQTQLTLDGIPLNAPGTAGNLRGFASDLFVGASVHMGPSLGGLGGSVNFTTLQPTLSWLSQASVTGASDGKYNYSFAESGSLGKLGIAVQNVYRSVPSLADGDLFLDASGQDYVHDGDSSYSGNLVKFRYQFSDSNSITGTFLNSARDTQLVCLRMYSPPALPCGYGPGSYSDASVQLYSLVDNALIGATQLQASVYSTTATNLYDALDRTIAVLAPYSSGSPSIQQPEAIVPSPAPIGYSGLAKTQGFMLNATLPAKEKHTFSIQAFATSSTNSTTPLVPEAEPYYNGSTQTAYDQLQLTDTIHSNDKLSLQEAVGLSSATGSGGASMLASSGLTWRPTDVDTYGLLYAVGGVAATAGHSTILTDPASLRFDCNGNVAYGNAPGQQPTRSSSNSARISYTRTLKRGNVSFQLYRQVQSGILLPIYLNGMELASTFPFGYMSQVRQLYDSPAGCNEPPGTPFYARQLYFTTPIADMQRVYQGGSLTGYLTLGDFVIQPYYDVNVAQAVGNNAYLFQPYSITISGDQLPNVPLQRAGIVFDYKAPHSILEWLADAQYVGRNNPNNLPAYTTYDAGVTAQLTTGTLTIAASNITNTYGGVYSGPENAVPYTTYGGYSIATTARPLTPRTYSVTYALKFGAGATSTQTGSAFNLPRGAEGGPGGGPGGPGGPGGRGPGGFRNFMAPLPATPPPDPLAVVPNAQRCTSDAQTNAQKLSGEIKAFVAQIEAAKTPAGYPATMAAPALSDASLTYHGLGDTYAVTVVPRGSGMRGLFGCFELHIARPDDVTQRKLYAPQNVGFFIPQITFMPSVGLYFTPRPPQAGQEQFRVYKLPASTPTDPFAVRTGTTCTAQAQSLAQQSLQELRAHFASGAPAPSWTIAAHDAAKGTWYQLDPADPTVVAAVVMCARVAATTQDELTGRGFGGAAVPSLNYAVPLGLYVVRNRLPGP